MRNVVLILLITLSFNSYSQIRKLSGYDPSTGRPGWIVNDTLRTLNLASTFLLAPNDTTLSFDSSKTWNTGGNQNTNSANNFIGTTDLISFQIRANNRKRIFIDSVGNIELYGRYPGNVGSYISRFFDSSSVMRHGFGSNGNQIWILNDGSGNVGSITVSTPNAVPGIAFYNASVLNRSEMRLKTGGGLQFGSLAGGTTPSIQFTMDVTGRFGIGVTSPTGHLHLPVNTTTVPSIQFTTASANKLTTPVSGALEYSGGKVWLQADGLALGTAVNASARLDVQSTTQGFAPPRMTAAQASAISSPIDGLMLYVTDTNVTFTSIGFWGRENSVWIKL